MQVCRERPPSRRSGPGRPRAHVACTQTHRLETADLTHSRTSQPLCVFLYSPPSSMHDSLLHSWWRRLSRWRMLPRYEQERLLIRAGPLGGRRGRLARWTPGLEPLLPARRALLVCLPEYEDV